ncbi:MAG: agmatinase [Acidimicrobiia bacterium]|nr:agmatinase [Acidimicrobiia bacterium]
MFDQQRSKSESASSRTCLLGVPYDAHSSFLRGPAGAPTEVRRVLHGGSANYWTELGVEVDPARWTDLGDLDLPGDVEPTLDRIAEASAGITADGGRLLSIGGDHMVTWPLVKGVAANHRGLTIVHFDAHPDLYDELDGDRHSHACPFARIMEEGLADRLVQIGIRTMTSHQLEQVERFGVEVHELRTWDGRLPGDLAGPVYVTIDMDALDPAFAPGVSHHEPGGMTTRQLVDCLHQLATMAAADGIEVVAADIVEINPERDIHDITAMVGAKLVRELLGVLILPSPSPTFS